LVSQGMVFGDQHYATRHVPVGESIRQ
ncbi:MAG: hypothetical protein JWN41_1756, partial [Thermoleophilia bacterium]|nr:hypothetical protein [Thermoleophilia bacterium]